MSKRMTVTLDDDVAQQLEEEARSSGQSQRAVVNEALRRTLKTVKAPAKPKRFHVKAYNMGLRPGLSLDCIGELLDQVEGPYRR